MAAHYTYSNVQDLVDDIVAQIPIYSQFGELKQVVINATPVTTDGHIFLFFKKFNPRYGDLLRYSYTTAEFQAEIFTQELPGINYYVNSVPFDGTIDSITPNVANTGDTVAETFGDYFGSVSGLYTATVTTDGALDGATAQITVTGPSNDPGPFIYTPFSGIAFPVGSHGLIMKFTAGISGVATLNDSWEISVTAVPTSTAQWDLLSPTQKSNYQASANSLIAQRQLTLKWFPPPP